MSARYLHRVRAVYADGTVFQRCYQSRSAAARRADQLRAGTPAVADYGHLAGFSNDRDAIPPATSVTVTRSLPVQWPDEPAPAPVRHLGRDDDYTPAAVDHTDPALLGEIAAALTDLGAAAAVNPPEYPSAGTPMPAPGAPSREA